jgi:flagellin
MRPQGQLEKMTKVISAGTDETGGCEHTHPEDADAGAFQSKRRTMGRQTSSEKELNPMALGVLNNLSAIYAENNLNNTNASLQTVLQQLSSGSRINSGADDAAGLSLVNGLGANSAALTQSETNATEGVGLLQVADGALSQVTSLLNRAITLATEASNGTLNSVQESAANQEYQSIMAEVANIGSTTTYNQEQVFDGSQIAIYAGDSSTAGASVDDLNIHPLTESSVGDTNGAMAYGTGSGQNGTNVFIDLSNDGTDATLTDSLNLTGSTAIQVNYLKTGADGVVSQEPATVTAGGASSYSNTVQGLINAINNSGLGLKATFGTAAEAGSGAVATAADAVYGGDSSSDTGIIISGAGVGTGTAAGVIGSLTVGNALDPLAGTLSITGSNGTTHTVTLGQADATDSIANLAATINAAGYGVTASVLGNTLTFSSVSSTTSVSGSNLTDSKLIADDGVGADPAAPVVSQAGAPLGNAAGTVGTLTLHAGTDILTAGVLKLTGQSGTAQSFTLGTPGTTDNLTDLAKTINNWVAENPGPGAGLVAQAVGNTLTIVSAGGGAVGVQTALVATTPVNSYSIPNAPTSITIAGTPTTNAASSSTVGTLTLGGIGESVTDVLNGTFKIGTTTLNLGGTGTTDTLQDLAKTIDANNYGVTATYNQTNKDIVFTSSNSALSSATALVYTPAALSGGDQTTPAGTVSYSNSNPVTTAEDYYSIGISSANGIQDQATLVGAGYGGTTDTGMTTDTSTAGGLATMSYTDAAGESLSGTDLINTSDAQTALGDLNLAIGDVAAQDGYIGAQINTLNSISQVMSTQQENIVSAQNAVQGTDYAAATSNMSKYEILSQTGIAALAQANSVQQEVLKLLQ